MAEQLLLDFDLTRRRRPKAAPPPPPPPPAAPPAWLRCWHGMRRLAWRVWLGFRWLLQRGGEFRTAFWIGSAILTAGLVWYGVSHWQVDFGDYRLKIERKNKPAETLKPWELEIRKGF